MRENYCLRRYMALCKEYRCGQENDSRADMQKSFYEYIISFSNLYSINSKDTCVKH